MNRADQAPEPSIEELLASIRLIISDADKQGPFQAEPRAPGATAPARSAPSELTADEVFDLTDELVSPGEAGRPLPGSSYGGMRGQPGPDGYPGPQAYPAARRGGALPAPDGASAMGRGRAGQERMDPAHALRPEARNSAQAPASGAVRSRRELPADAGQPPAASGRPRLEHLPARPQARNWAGDIQMPVPDQGPVSLFPAPPGKGQPEKPDAEGAGFAGQQEDAQAEPVATPGDAEAPADVAALAQRLARSAIGVLEARELENAKQVDFEHLDAVSKAEVTERFADAIEVVAQAVQEEPDLAEIADGQVSEPSQLEKPAAQSVAEAVPALAEGVPAGDVPGDADGEAVVQAEAPLQAEAGAGTRTEPEPEEAAFEPVPAAGPVNAGSANVESPVQTAPAKQPAASVPLVVQQPLAQAQFMGHAQPSAPIPGGGALEGVVREMLRPLLVQWLNENMPRILENAIREEIAVRALPPKSDS